MRIRKNIELFHILFCKSLLTSQDKTLIVLKGGCNLRFFLHSNRYSEDIDFDVETIARETLRKRVDKTLSAQTFKLLLLANKIELITHSAPKQTDTVQRWKVRLRVDGLELPSKIEFSSRGIEREGTFFETIDSQVLAMHRLTPTFLTHYGPEYAIMQKIEALADRSETQARDIYDLGHLFSRFPSALLTLPKSIITRAIECALSVDFDQFRGQVVEYLEDDARTYYMNTSSWDKLQIQVISALEAI